MTPAASRWRSLIAPGIATLVALAILLTLGIWQLQRKSWKEGLIGQIEARSHGEPGAILPEDRWGTWRANDDEFRRVRLEGALLNAFETPVYGLAPAQRGSPLQGFYLMTPLRLSDGAIVMINRGFVPTALRDPKTRPQSQPQGHTAIIGLVRAPEARNTFTPPDDPARSSWFTRDPQAIAKAHGLDRVAPFLIDADSTPNPGGWPRGGQTRLNLPNDHLQYAFTWFGIAATLLGVFGVFAWRKLHPPAAAAPK